MKTVSSLKSARKRNSKSQLIKRRGKLIVINKNNPRLKTKQG